MNSELLTGSDVAYFQIFGSAIYDGFCYFDKIDIDEITFSDNFITLLGYDRDCKLNVADVLHFYDLPLFLSMLALENERGEIAASKELHIITKLGEILLMNCQIFSKPTKEKNSSIVFAGFKIIGISNSTEIESISTYKRNEKVLNAAAVGTWQFHMKSGKKIWSEQFTSIIGYEADEFEDINWDFWFELMSADETEKTRQKYYSKLYDKSYSFRKELQLKHKKGHYIWVIVVGNVFSFDSNNEAEWMGGIIYDITERKNLEFSGKKFEGLMPQVNNAAKIGIWEVNMATKEVYFSDELKKIIGVPQTFVPSFKYGFEFINEGENRRKIISAVRKAIKKGVNYDLEVEATNLSGEPVWIRSIGITEFREGKCSRFYGFLQDISEKKNFRRELAIKEELFKKTFFYAPYGMAITDLDGNISQVNNKLCGIFGYEKQEMLAIKINDLSHPDDNTLVDAAKEALLSHSTESYTVDKRYIHKNGSIIWAQKSLSSITDETGAMTNFVVQIQDITERKKSELLLINYKDLLERSNYVAKIGSWEIDVTDGTVSWSQSLESVINTRINTAPKFEDSIEHLSTEVDKEKMKSAFKNAIELGENFDLQLRFKDGTGNVKWVRMIGIAEFYNSKCQRLYGLIQDINDLKQAQFESSSKEELWRTTFNHANAGIALINFDGQPYNVNQSFCEIFGYTIEEMVDIRIKDISLREELTSNIAKMNDLINGVSTTINSEMRFLHKDQHIIWANVTVAAVRNDFNQFTHMVAQVIDITKSKTNELLLEKYMKILERSNEVAKIGSWEFDPTTLTLHFSKNLHRLVGKVEDFNRYEPNLIKDYILKKDRNFTKSLVAEAINEGKSFDIELEILTSFGVRWMRLIGISDFENGRCKLLHGLVQDIHEIKSALMEIQIREQEFRQSFWYASTGMALVDLNGKVIRANPFLCEMFGYSMQELIELDKVLLPDPNDGQLTTHFIEQLISGERDSFVQEKRYYHKNKNIIWAILSMSTVKDDKGKATHFVALIADITDKKLLTQNLTEHNNRLQNYAHIVSHNLRSHTGNLMMLLELSEINDEQKIDQELFDHIKSAASNMSETVAHLSEIVEIQNLIKNTLVPQNLRKRVKKALENVQATLTMINGKVSINIDEEFMVYAIPSYLDSIILNLLTNAIKYRSNERPLTIKIVAEHKNGRTSLSFTDNGLGIDLERYGTKIFGMYKTFHDHKDARGIGLFMTKNQLEAMGSDIEVESKQDVGSTFTIYFSNERN